MTGTLLSRLTAITALASLLLAACAAPATTGGSQPALGDWWPPVAPRQPERLVAVSPAIADPLLWWKTNIFDALPASVYQRPEQQKYALAVIKQTNETRRRYGLSELRLDPLLSAVAQAHARDQGIRDYWAHPTPEGLHSWDRLRAAGGPVMKAGGENSNAYVGDVPTNASSVVRDWEYHAGHRELLLNPAVRYIGVGVYQQDPAEVAFVVALLMDY